MDLIIGSFRSLHTFLSARFPNFEAFKFALSYSDETGEAYEELNRFCQQSAESRARFKNSYVGAVVIDLTEWCGKPINSKLSAFIYFLKDRELCDRRNKTTFISERYLDDAVIETIEDIFEKDVTVLDLGVKSKAQRHIGFQVTDDREDVQNVRG